MRLDSENFSKFKEFIPTFLHDWLIKVFYRFRSFFYRGHAVYCNCCSNSYALFLPPHKECPGCGSQARHRLIRTYLQSETDLFARSHRLLHFAPEMCLENFFKSVPDIDYVSADLVLPRAMEKIDITDIGHPDSSFSVILCSHVLEHIPDDAKAMRELHRVLSPTGWAILQVPLLPGREKTYEDPLITDPIEREKHFGRRDHYRRYGPDYASRLERAGFKVVVDGYVKSLPINEIEKYGFDDFENIYFCTKN